MHMMKANSTLVAKVDSFAYIKPASRNSKPNSQNNRSVVKSLEEWAAKILCWDNNDYVRQIANSDKETKNASKGLKNMGRLNMP